MVLASARRHQATSALVARRAVVRARAVGSAPVAVAGVVATHQAMAAALSQTAVTNMLAEQSIRESADALLNVGAFTTSAVAFTSMLDAANAPGGLAPVLAFERLVLSLVQDAGRAAEQVAVATRRDVGWARQLTPPSCTRCAVLAGRVYRFSDGFERHPGDDCITVPVREGDSSFAADPRELLAAGQLRGLSKADQRAIDLGADFSQVVNVRGSRAGLTRAGEVLSRRGRPTPAGIFDAATSREDALQRLSVAGYLR